jgi:anti-sigma regulatory factor (Ser/Thr protein kinase)
MQHSRHPAPAACRASGPNAGGAVAVAAPAAGAEPVPALPQNTALSWSFPGSALDVSLSRRWLAAAVEQAWGAGDDADRVVLAYSEVATNAVVHGAGPVTVRTRILDGAVTCEVADCSARAPRPRHAADDDVRGRGLDLVAMTVDRFRVDLGEGGKTVSFEVGRRLGARTGSGRSPLGQSGPGPAGGGTAAESEPEPANGSEPEPAEASEPGSGAGSGTGLLKAGSAGESGGGSTGGGGAA